MTAIILVDVPFTTIKSSSIVEVKHHGFDEVYNQNTYKIEGYNFWIPEDDLEFIPSV